MTYAINGNCAGCSNGCCTGNCHRQMKPTKIRYNKNKNIIPVNDLPINDEDTFINTSNTHVNEVKNNNLIIPYANIIEALEYLKVNINTIFEHPISYTPTMIKMLTEEEKSLLRSCKHLKYSKKELIKNQFHKKLK